MSDTSARTTKTRQTYSREQEADRDLRHTSLSPGAGVVLCLILIATIVAVPVAQTVIEVQRAQHARQEARKKGYPLPSLAPQWLDVLSLLPSLTQIRSVHSLPGAWGLLTPTTRIRAYENALEQKSVLTEWLLPRTQMFLSDFLGLGNEEAYLGRGQWLFYRPDVDYVTSPGFLEPWVLKARRQSGGGDTTPVQPDPVRAIVNFKRQLASRGIQLVLVPAPVKPVIEPDALSSRYYLPQAPVQNPSYRRFIQEVEKAGVPVFDAAGILSEARVATGSPPYLETDTHWTWSAMDHVAQRLAEFLQARCGIPAAGPDQYTRRPATVTNLGDIAVMLKLPARQTLYEPQRVTTQQVFQPDGSPWAPARHSDILLLGDSFSNIYSLSGMNWGSDAGFAEQLIYYLQRPLDRIVINAGGASASRQSLVDEMARDAAHGRDRLAGKRIVIYEFATRDLVSGDWKLINLPPSPGLTHVAHPQPVPLAPAPNPQPSPSGTLIASLPKQQQEPGVVSPPGSAVSGTGVSARTNSQSNGRLPLPGVGHETSGSLRPPGFSGVSGTVGPRDGKQPTVQTANQGVRPPAATGSRPGAQGRGSGHSSPIAATHPAPAPAPAGGPNSNLVVRGVIKAVSSTPRPGSVPYRDCVIALRLTGVKAIQGQMKGDDIVVYVWGMRNDQLTPQASYQPGQTVTLTLRPWESVEDQYGGYNRHELDDPATFALNAYWGAG